MLVSLPYTELPMLRDWVIFEKFHRKQNKHLNSVAYCTREQCSNFITQTYFVNKAFERQIHAPHYTHRGHRHNKKISQGLRKLLSSGFGAVQPGLYLETFRRNTLPPPSEPIRGRNSTTLHSIDTPEGSNHYCHCHDDLKCVATSSTATLHSYKRQYMASFP